MSYKKGDVLLVNFPFTDLSSSKKRPVLAIKDESEYGDIVCFQIISKKNQSSLMQIQSADILKEPLKLTSFVKYDKCFTIDSNIIDKKLTDKFCNEVF